MKPRFEIMSPCEIDSLFEAERARYEALERKYIKLYADWILATEAAREAELDRDRTERILRATERILRALRKEDAK